MGARGRLGGLTRELKSSSNQAHLEPIRQVIKRDGAVSNSNHYIVNWFIIWHIPDVVTALNQDYHAKPCRPLIAVDKPVITDHAFKKRRRFQFYLSVVSRIRASNRGFDKIKAANSRTSAIGQRLVMRCNRICERHPIVALTY